MRLLALTVLCAFALGSPDLSAQQPAPAPKQPAVALPKPTTPEQILYPVKENLGLQLQTLRDDLHQERAKLQETAERIKKLGLADVGLPPDVASLDGRFRSKLEGLLKELDALTSNLPDELGDQMRNLQIKLANVHDQLADYAASREETASEAWRPFWTKKRVLMQKLAETCREQAQLIAGDTRALRDAAEGAQEAKTAVAFALVALDSVLLQKGAEQMWVEAREEMQATVMTAVGVLDEFVRAVDALYARQPTL